MKKRLLGNTLALGLVQVANYVVPLIALLYLTSTLGVERYGVLAFSQGLVGISLVLIDFGFSLSATEKISKQRDDKTYVGKVIGGVVLVQFVFFAIASLFIVGYGLSTEKYAEHQNVFLLALLPMLGQGLTPVWFFHGIERMKHIAILTVAGKVLFIALVVGFIHRSEEYYLVPAFNGISQLIVLLFAFQKINQLGYKIVFPDFAAIKYCINFSKQFFLSRVAVAGYMSSAPVILGLSSSASTVAMYSVAEQLYKAMQSAFSPVAAAYPYMAKEKDIGLMLRIIGGCIALAATGAMVGFFVSPMLMRTFFNPSWLNSLPVLNVFFVAIVVHAAAVVTGYPLAAALGKVQVANTSVILGACIYFVLMFSVYACGLISPVVLAILMVISESYVLIHRTIFLLLPALVFHKNQTTKEKNHE